MSTTDNTETTTGPSALHTACVLCIALQGRAAHGPVGVWKGSQSTLSSAQVLGGPTHDPDCRTLITGHTQPQQKGVLGVGLDVTALALGMTGNRTGVPVSPDKASKCSIM